MTSYLFSLLMATTHTLFALRHSGQTIFIIQSHSSLLLTCCTASFEPASYITQNSSSELLIPLSTTFIWTCRSNLLHTDTITFHHFFTVSLRAQYLPFQKILSSTLVCFCLSGCSHDSKPFTGFICSSISCFSSICFCFIDWGRHYSQCLVYAIRRTVRYLACLVGKSWRAEPSDSQNWKKEQQK